MTPQEWIESTKRRWDSGHLYEGAQHLAAALEEIARLQAQLSQAERVVIPEPSQDEWLRIAADARSANTVDFLSGAAAYGLWLRGKMVDSVPASRVLKDGEVAVLKAELSALRELERGYRGTLMPSRLMNAFCEKLDALRAQGNEGAT